MIIAGFQSLSLLDYPGIIASIVFTQGCIFRCPYCHNPQLVPRAASLPTISDKEVFAKLLQHQKMIEGVCITGGEPTIHPDLPDFIRELKRMRFLVKLDTNGINPPMVKQLFDERLVDYIAMDLKQTWDKYDQVVQAGVGHVVENCKQTYELISRSGVQHEFRTTIYSGLHTESDIIEMGARLPEGERYILQPIRYGGTLDPELKQLPSLDVERISRGLKALRPDLEILIRT